MGLELLAGRFARVASGWLDVATGRPVRVLGYDDVPLARAARDALCAAATRACHSAMAPLVDCAELGDGRWIEAWGVPPAAERWTGRGAGGVRRAVARWLAHEGVEPGDLEVLDVAGRPVVVPHPATPDSAPVPDTRRGGGPRTAAFAVRLVPRAVSGAILARIEDVQEPGPRVCAIDAPPGSGARELWRQLARIVRHHGFVPVHAGCLDWCLGPPGDDPGPLVVWHELPAWSTAGRQALAALLVRLGAATPARSVVLDVVRQGRPAPAALALAPVDRATLARAVWWDGRPEPSRARLLAIAKESGGWPGRFVERLRRLADGDPPPGAAPAPMRVHEPPAPYGAAAAGDAASGAIERAMRLSSAGRWAAGLRHLQRSLAASARRGDDRAAAALALEQARLAERRGAPEAIARAWQAAHRLVVQSGPDAARLELAVALGAAWCRDGRLRQAEALLRAAVESAVMLGEASHADEARRALARCLCWQARWGEAAAVIDRVERADTASIRVWLLLGSGDLARASALAAEALARTRASGSRAALLGALAVRTRCDAVAGDRERVDAAMHEILTVDANRGALDTGLRAVCLLEAAVHGRLAPVPRAILTAARRMAAPGWPRLLRCRARLALALFSAGPGSHTHLEALIRRFVLETGAGALLPDAAAPWPWPAPAPRSLPMLKDVMDVLHACQAAQAPDAALQHVTRLLRERTGAASVAVMGGMSTRDVRALALAGRVPATNAARRAMDLRLAVRPETAGDDVEAASPVVYGGEVLGALCCRWPPGDARPGGETLALLETVAAAVAPSVRLALEALDGGLRTSDADEDGLLGASPLMAALRRQVKAAGCAPFPVLVEGESGSGKELVSRAIHRHSARRGRAFCALNCAALGDDLVEAELFGHARGAFTGAATERAGLFEEADGGTLFLDEVSELSARAQAKLLRALQEGEIRRLGETRPRTVDVRVIAASNRPIRDLVAAGRFRTDLRYRLDVIRIEVPPLRARSEDVPLLVRHFWRQAASRVNSRAVLAPETCAALVSYDWPGNVRELQNVLAALAVAAPRAGRIGPGCLPEPIGRAAARPLLPLDEARRQFEAAYVRNALARAGGNRRRAALALGVTRQGLAKLIERLQLAPEAADRGTGTDGL